MGNKTLFDTTTRATPADATNRAGGRAYGDPDRHALAQLIATSTLSNTFYATAEEQVDQIVALAAKLPAPFVAKAAVYAAESAKLKDTPALLLAHLAGRPDAGPLVEAIFPRVVKRPKQLGNFMTMVRSGRFGSRSFGTATKRAIRTWLAGRPAARLFTGSVMDKPSFADLVKLAHPKPESDQKRAFYGYMLGKPEAKWLPAKPADLPEVVLAFETFKAALKGGGEAPIPDVPFQMLTSLPLTPAHYQQIARQMPWNALRQNLNNLARHGAFADEATVAHVAAKLGDRVEVGQANAFPYELLASLTYVDATVPAAIRLALQDALDAAVDNVPAFAGGVAVCPDVSGSMSSAISARQGSGSKIRYVDIAALVAAAVLRKNPEATILPFDGAVRPVTLNPRDSIHTNATRLAINGGYTNCAAALRFLNDSPVGAKPRLVIFVSDFESCYDSPRQRLVAQHFGGTTMAQEWARYRRAVPDAKLVCLDVDPNQTSQVPDGAGVMNIGGFSDRVWAGITRFVEHDRADFAGLIEATELQLNTPSRCQE